MFLIYSSKISKAFLALLAFFFAFRIKSIGTFGAKTPKLLSCAVIGVVVIKFLSPRILIYSGLLILRLTSILLLRAKRFKDSTV